MSSTHCSLCLEAEARALFRFELRELGVDVERRPLSPTIGRLFFVVRSEIDLLRHRLLLVGVLRLHENWVYSAALGRRRCGFGGERTVPSARLLAELHDALRQLGRRRRGAS